MKYDKAWVERARKDLLTVLGNIPKVKTERDLREVVDTIRGYDRRVLGSHIFADDPGGYGTLRGLLQSLRARLREVGGEKKTRIEWVVKDVGTATGALINPLSDLLYFSRTREQLDDLGLNRGPAYGTVEEWKKGALKFKERAMRAARKLWEVLIVWAEKYPELFATRNLETPVKIAGFDVVLDDYDPTYDPTRDDYSERLLAEWTEALRRFRRQALAVMPVMVRRAVPFHFIFRLELDKGGSYSAGSPRNPPYVNLYMRHDRIEEHVKVIAHEMGHHLYRTLLTQASRDDWEATIQGRRAELSVAEILERWPKTRPGWENPPWAYELSRYTDDPIFGLRMEAIAQRLGYQEKREFEALPAKGVTTINVPETPITGYAEKNPEEAFCEAVGLLVAYGTQAVHPRVRHWLDVVVGRNISFGRAAGRKAPEAPLALVELQKMESAMRAAGKSVALERGFRVQVHHHTGYNSSAPPVVDVYIQRDMGVDEAVAFAKRMLRETKHSLAVYISAPMLFASREAAEELARRGMTAWNFPFFARDKKNPKLNRG